MARFTRRFSVPRELSVAALVVAAALPLSRLFRPGGFSGVVLAAALLSIGISWLARRFRIPAVVGLLLSVLGLFWFLTGRFHAHTLWGIFPTPASATVLVHSVREGVSQTINYAVPVPTTPALLTFVAAGVWMSAWLADAAALWVGNPLLAIAGSTPASTSRPRPGFCSARSARARNAGERAKRASGGAPVLRCASH